MIIKKLNKLNKKRIVFMIIVVPIILAVFPIKFTKKSIDSINAKEFYIVKCVSEGSTDAGCWFVIGNHDGMLDECIPVNFTGRNPKSILSYDICNNYTEFIIYGSLTKENDEKFYTLNSRRWQISGEVKRGDYSCRISFKHFITIYDLNWFDFLLTDKGVD